MRRIGFPLFVLAVLTGGAWWLLQTLGSRPVASSAEVDAPSTSPTSLVHEVSSPETGGVSRSPANPLPAKERSSRIDLSGAGFRLRVVDERQNPLAGARLRAAKMESDPFFIQPDCDWSDPELELLGTAITDEQGIGVLAGLPECVEVQFAVDSPAHTRVSKRLLTPADGELLELGSWALEPATTVVLTLVDQIGNPASNLEIALWANTSEAVGSEVLILTRTDAEGRVILEHVPKIGLNLTVRPFGRYLIGPYRDVLAPGQREARVELDTGEFASGAVLEDGGDPVAGADIFLLPTILDFEFPEGDLFAPWQWSGPEEPETSTSQTKSDSRGAFRVGGIPRDGTPIVLLAHLAPGQWFSGRWTRQRDGIEVRIPSRHILRGCVQGAIDLGAARLIVERILRRAGLDEEQWEEEIRYDLEDLELPFAPDGSFEILLPEASYALGVAYPGGYTTLAEELVLDADQDLGLHGIGGGCELTVYWPEAPVDSDAAPYLQRAKDEQEGAWNRLARVSPLRIGPSAWTFRHLAPGTYRAVLDGSEIEPIAAVVRLEGSEAKRVLLAPQASGSIVVELLADDPSALAGRTVTLTALDADDGERTRMLQTLEHRYPESEHLVAADGRARASDLPAGRYRAHLQHEEGVDTSLGNDGQPIGEILLTAGARATLSAEMKAFGSARFVVLEQGRPKPGVGIAYTLLDEGGVMLGRIQTYALSGTTGVDGSWTAHGLAHGRYLAVAFPQSGQARNDCEFVVSAGTTEIVIELGSGLVRGSILTEGGTPAQASLTLCSAALLAREEGMTASLADLPLHDAIHSLGIAGSSTDALGTFHFSLVPPGKYRVHATADDGRAVWSPWFEVEVAGEVNLGALTLIETQEFRWPVFGLEAWGGRYLRLRFRSVTTGEVAISILLHRSVWEAETNLTLRLPHGSWSVELSDFSDEILAKVAVIEVNATGAVPALTLPSPAALGLETY